jgi:prevent-host-death family protein
MTIAGDHGDTLVTMKTIAAGVFKAKCLQIMDEVGTTGESVIVTKRGRAVAKLVPVREADPSSIFGCMRDSARIVGDITLSPWQEEFGDRDPIVEKWERLNK